MVYLYDANQSQLANRGAQTDENGRATFVFEADPPYGDADVWGQLTMDIIVNDPDFPHRASKPSKPCAVKDSLHNTNSKKRKRNPWWSYLLVWFWRR